MKKAKRLLAVLLALAMAFALLPTFAPTAQAGDHGDTDIVYPVTGGNLYFDKENGTITDCDDSVTEAIIPAQIDGVAVTKIGESAFRDDDYTGDSRMSLQSVEIASSVTSIGERAFYGCASLQSIEIPNSVTEIGDEAFYGCTSLQSMEIPNSTTSIGDYAFRNCTSLQSIEIPSSVTSIGNFVFDGCTSLQSIEIPNSVTKIGNSAFDGCTSLQNIEIPSSVTEIGEYAFYNCESLQSIEIPNGVTEIGYETFCGCTSLQSIEIPNSVTKIYDYAFSGCESLQSVTIPNGVTEIGWFAFYGCMSLQNVEIPNNVTEIGYGAFSACAGLYEINIAEDNSAYCSREGVLFSKDGETLCIFPAGKPDHSYAIPSGTIAISNYAFDGCENLQNIKIPNSVTTIHNWAFSRCASLQSVEIPNSVTEIQWFAFSDCTSLQSVTIPDSVTEIRTGAFSDCTSLKTVLFLGNAPGMGGSVFQTRNDELESLQNIPGLTLYYIEGKTGWTTPTWKGYPTRTWDGKTTPSQFTDVAANSWFAGAVKYAVEHNLFNGTGDGTTFSPNMAMSRAMLVTVLHRQAGTPASSGENVFSDVPNTSWYTKAVLWASENGIVTGSNGRFMPNDAVTREQISVILFRYTQKQGKDTSSRADLAAFPDGNLVSGWAKDAMQWAVAEKLISGNTKGELMPKGEASRAQVATILMRYIENILK